MSRLMRVCMSFKNNKHRTYRSVYRIYMEDEILVLKFFDLKTETIKLSRIRDFAVLNEDDNVYGKVEKN